MNGYYALGIIGLGTLLDLVGKMSKQSDLSILFVRIEEILEPKLFYPQLTMKM